MEKPGVWKLEVGQLAEMKTFETGFRGAWFRCKINDIDLKRNKINLEYYDFEEEITWTKIYEVPPYARKSKQTRRQLMLRPRYPLLYQRNEMPPGGSVSELCVVIDGAWKDGDLVDWYKDDCYWSARVTKVLGNDEVQIELPMPPAGEGEGRDGDILIAAFKDLRPSLEWSQRKGWSLPTVDGQTTCGAVLIFPPKQEKEEAETIAAVGSPPNASSTTGAGIDESVTSSAEENTKKHSSEAVVTAIIEDVKMDDLESTDSISSTRIEECKAAEADKEYIDYSVDLNIMHEETLEAPILDLEELACKIKWIKSILNSNQRPSSSSSTTSWKFS